MRTVVLFVLFLVAVSFTNRARANEWIPDYVPVPIRLKNALPHVQVFNTGGRPVVVVSSKMPCEAISGNRSPPADVMRWVANTFAELANASAVVGFDVEVVCSSD